MPKSIAPRPVSFCEGSNCRLDTLVKLAGALGVSPCDLIEGIVFEPAEVTSGQFKIQPGKG